MRKGGYTMKCENLSTEELSECLRLRRCTDAEQEKAGTENLNGLTKEQKIDALDAVRRLRKLGWRF